MMLHRFQDRGEPVVVTLRMGARTLPDAPSRNVVAEIVGRTEPGAALIVNGQSVPNVSPDGAFRHFTEPLEPGQHTISIIGSNRRGGTAMKQVSIVVPK